MKVCLIIKSIFIEGKKFRLFVLSSLYKYLQSIVGRLSIYVSIRTLGLVVARFLFLFIYLKKKQKKVKEESDTKQMSDERFPTQSISLFHVYVKTEFFF
jgi:Ca2+/Na+ antiporter